ncbi:uncharacterized protein LOC142229231 [Haematobia irritans]|uniref:uncharacterized protein LOC142229231 n=1 Tax=Haematobia irritans TaxID=7368 RepID=UPI003F50A7E8
MYRKILVNPEHRSFQRVLFRRNPNESVQDYQLDTVTFGVNCAPFLAIRTLLQLADDIRETFPLACNILRNAMYVDDALVGAHSIPEAMESKEQLVSALNSADSIKVPRWFNYTPKCDVQFHGFSDASEKAYAAALYVRIREEESVSVHLVSCKTKVAPLKTLSIPRLELCGATLLAEMIDRLVPQLEIRNCSIFCWTDSTIVLSWLAKPPCYWSTFVANRVSKIIQAIGPARWHHVKSKENPADLASRGVYPQDLLEIIMVQDRLVSMTQRAHFPNEYLALSSKKQVASASPFLNLNPFLDSEGIMRVCGRLVSSPGLSYNEKSYYSALQLPAFPIVSPVYSYDFDPWRCRKQLMSSLPPERSEYSRPFTHTGLDFTGPFDIKSFSGRACRMTKGYTCVFVCFATKAIHLEAVSDMGGLWEAGVKSFKSHFRKAAGNFKHTFEEFQTLLSRIEACLNSRPLCSASTEASDLSALTPGHFLIGSPILNPLDPKISESPTSLVNRWQRLKVMHQHFCLQSDLVVIKEENLPPNCWRLGRISKVHPGSDGKVRAVDIVTEKGYITRPITKIVILPSDSTN